MLKVKEATVAGLFYPSNSLQLSRMLDDFLNQKKDEDIPQLKSIPSALIAPHAGYPYSGIVAMKAFAQLIPFAHDIKRVAILAPAHTIPLQGMALSQAEYFSTPLGQVVVNHDMDDLLKIEMGAQINDSAFEKEHAIEVQLPFLQKILPHFSILPIVVGQTDASVVERVINHLVNNKFVVVISTDLTHYLPYNEAKIEDEKTKELIEKKNWSKIQPDHACGHYPLRGMIKWCQSQKKNIQTLELINSGDTAGDKKKVVGYGAWVVP